jgi:myosin heavy subunit
MLDVFDEHDDQTSMLKIRLYLEKELYPDEEEGFLKPFKQRLSDIADEIEEKRRFKAGPKKEKTREEIAHERLLERLQKQKETLAAAEKKVEAEAEKQEKLEKAVVKSKEKMEKSREGSAEKRKQSGEKRKKTSSAADPDEVIDLDDNDEEVVVKKRTVTVAPRKSKAEWTEGTQPNLKLYTKKPMGGKRRLLNVLTGDDANDNKEWICMWDDDFQTDDRVKDSSFLKSATKGPNQALVAARNAMDPASVIKGSCGIRWSRDLCVDSEGKTALLLSEEDATIRDINEFII